MSYTPQPGTVPYRVITWLKLQPTGAEFTSAQISDSLEIMGATISQSLDYPKKAGAVRCRKGADGLLYWSLGNGIPQPKPADYEPDVPLEQLPPIKRRPERQKADAPVQVPVFLQGQPAAHTTQEAPKQRGGIDVAVIERLRSAALSHGEVADLLQVLGDCLAFTGMGEDLITCDESNRAYLQTVLLAAQFAAYDRGEAAKDGV